VDAGGLTTAVWDWPGEDLPPDGGSTVRRFRIGRRCRNFGSGPRNFSPRGAMEAVRYRLDICGTNLAEFRSITKGNLG